MSKSNKNITVNLKYMKTNNFGDALNPILFKYITGKNVNHVGEKFSGDCWLFIGSILNWSKGNNKCWGAGLAHENVGEISGTIHMVRGPKTIDVLKSRGIKCPDDIYGDPAILISEYYKPNVDKKYKLGVIPHIVDFKNVKINNSDILKIDLKNDYKSVIKDILSCEKIISSSLHGLIIADSYQIPSAWCEFSDRVIGNGFKFYDYYQSIDVKNPLRLNFKNGITTIDKKFLTSIEKYDNLQLKDGLLKNCPL